MLVADKESAVCCLQQYQGWSEDKIGENGYSMTFYFIEETVGGVIFVAVKFQARFSVSHIGETQEDS